MIKGYEKAHRISGRAKEPNIEATEPPLISTIGTSRNGEQPPPLPPPAPEQTHSSTYDITSLVAGLMASLKLTVDCNYA